MNSIRHALLGLTLALAATSASAQDARVVRDARCLLAMGAIGADPNAKTAASMGVFYFAGRISARDPAFDFSKRLKPVAEQMRVADLQAEAKRCGAEMMQASKALDAAQAGLAGVKPKP